MRATRAALGCLLLSGGACVTATAQTHSMGTLVSCPSDRAAPCLWAGENGQVIDTHALRSRMLATNSVGNLDAETAARNLERHMTYLENVHRYAQSVGHEFSYKMGVNERHLSDSSKRAKLPEMFVHQEMRAAKAAAMRRRLMTAATMSSSSSSTNTSEFNWCNTENPKGRSVCSAVKSQQNCGSCWAFAAADAIETAVAIAANQTTAVALSPQQFLSCSTRETEQTFEYCWATSGVSGVTWLSDSIKWKSTNNGCDGGMTHGAFMDAAQLHFGLVTELEMPYSDSSGSSGSNQTCVTTSNETAASITDWTQIVGKDCSVSSDPNVLLRNALQDQPIAVALNSEDPFKDYSGGFYSCPNDGVLSSKDDINHALLLVGYGTDATSGNYWILKNSYGTSWGDKGYMKLLADSKANCGLNIFPVIPLGATAGVATATVDGGGAKKFLGLSPGAWIALAVVLSVVTIILTAIGVWYSSKKRAALREQNSGAIYLSQTPQHTDGATF